VVGKKGLMEGVTDGLNTLAEEMDATDAADENRREVVVVDDDVVAVDLPPR